jgi:hypothetical protein
MSISYGRYEGEIVFHDYGNFNLQHVIVRPNEILFGFRDPEGPWTYEAKLTRRPADNTFHGGWQTQEPLDSGNCWCHFAYSADTVKLKGHWSEGDNDFPWGAELTPKRE